MSADEFFRCSGYFFEFLQTVAPLVVLLWVTDRVMEEGRK